MNFQAIAFVDGSQCTAGYVKQFRTRLKDGEISLWSGGKPMAILQEWKSAKVLLAKISNAVAPLLGGRPAILRSAHVLTMAPKDIQEWAYPDASTVRAYLSLLPSPAAMLFSGIEGHNPPVGQLTVVNGSAPFSAVNLGPVPATWLVVDAEIPVRED